MKCTSIIVFTLLYSCNASEDKKTAPTPTVVVSQVGTPDPKAPTPKAPETSSSDIEPKIASVQLNQDCPDKLPVRADQSAMASRMRAKGYSQPCTQSSIQIAFSEHVGASAVQVTIREIRLLTEKGDEIVKLKSRLPTIWKDSGYQPWDGQVVPNTGSFKTSYKLASPDWSVVETKLGRSHGLMFWVDVDIEIGGVMKTIRSPQFTRGKPENIRT